MFRGYAGPADPPAGEMPGEGLLNCRRHFSDLLTGFRVAEFNHYLRVFPGLRIACTTPSFGEMHTAYSASYPDLADRVVAWDRHSFDAARAVYLVFLNNAHHWVPELEARGLPFGFTLYPAGGNNLNDAASSGKLVRVLSSPALRGVIATQPITLEILDRHGCRAPVTYVPGVTVNPMYLCRPRVSHACRRMEKQDLLRGAQVRTRWRRQGVPAVSCRRRRRRRATLHRNILGNRELRAGGQVGAGRSGRPARFQGAPANAGAPAAFLERDIMIAPSRRFLTTGSEFDGFPDRHRDRGCTLWDGADLLGRAFAEPALRGRRGSLDLRAGGGRPRPSHGGTNPGSAAAPRDATARPAENARPLRTGSATAATDVFLRRLALAAGIAM